MLVVTFSDPTHTCVSPSIVSDHRTGCEATTSDASPPDHRQTISGPSAAAGAEIYSACLDHQDDTAVLYASHDVFDALFVN